MSENKFENQVQHLMDELKFTPSEQVWPAIKNRIREKRRRRIFFFLVPVMAGLLITGYYFLSKTNFLPVSQKEVVDLPVKKTEISQDAENKPVNIPNAKNSKTNIPEEFDKTPDDNDVEQTKIKEKNVLVKNDPSRSQIPTTIQNPAEDLKTPTGTINSITKNKPVDYYKEEILTDSVNDQKINESNINQTIGAKIFQDSVSFNSEIKQNEIISDSIPPIKDTAKVVLIKKEQRSKWIWGIHAAVGVSKSGSKTLPGFTPALMDYNSSPNAGGPLFAMPSKSSQTGPAFTAGFIIKRQLTTRSSLASGLQYLYASDRIMAGSRYDSTIQVQNRNSNSLNFSNTVNSYYRGNDQWYNNHYHFMELPLHYQYLMNIKSKVPIQLQAGLIFSQLISSNGLIYDRTLAGIYYEDKKQFNQSMLSLSSGINVQLNHKQKLKWSIGPQVRAGITSLRNATYDQNKFLFSVGLGVNLFLD